MVRSKVVAVLALVMVAAAGCSRVPAGVDKDLVDEWAMLAEAKVPEPVAGACWTSYADDVWDLVGVTVAATPVACDAQHIIETVHVGHFTGAQADADRPPPVDQMTDAYAACDAELTKFLGASWQLGRARMLVFPPTTTQWRGGARFYRCDVASLRGINGDFEERTASLKGSLQPGGDRLLGCAVRTGTEDSWSDMTPAACTTPHDLEFLGIVGSRSATRPAGTDAVRAAFGTPCLDQLRAYTKASDNTLAKAKVRYGYQQIAAGVPEWSTGNHNAYCFVLLPKKITRSLKNNGNTAI